MDDYAKQPKRLGTGIYVAVPAGVNTELVGAAGKRLTLSLGSDNANGVLVGTKEMMVAGLQFGFFLSTSTQPMVLRYEDLGSILHEAWFARSLAGAANVCVVEVMPG